MYRFAYFCRPCYLLMALCDALEALLKERVWVQVTWGPGPE